MTLFWWVLPLFLPVGADTNLKNVKSLLLWFWVKIYTFYNIHRFSSFRIRQTNVTTQRRCGHAWVSPELSDKQQYLQIVHENGALWAQGGQGADESTNYQCCQHLLEVSEWNRSRINWRGSHILHGIWADITTRGKMRWFPCSFRVFFQLPVFLT